MWAPRLPGRRPRNLRRATSATGERSKIAARAGKTSPHACWVGVLAVSDRTLNPSERLTKIVRATSPAIFVWAVGAVLPRTDRVRNEEQVGRMGALLR